MDAFLLPMLLLAMAVPSSANWCICKDGLSDAVLQKTLDYACGAGADCVPIHQTGACFQPNTVRAHCSYAVNSYFQKNRQAQGTCDFAGTSTPTTSDPSPSSTCVYPAIGSSAGTTTPSTTPATSTTPSPTPATTTTPTTAAPYTGTPSTGVLGGIGSGAGSSGVNADYSHGELRLKNTGMLSLLVMLFLSSLMHF